jgi:hypothetical protein
VSLSPGGWTLVVAVSRAPSGGIEIIDVDAPVPHVAVAGRDGVGPRALTPDGRFIVDSSYQGWARLWSTKTRRPATRALAAHSGAV